MCLAPRWSSVLSLRSSQSSYDRSFSHLNLRNPLQNCFSRRFQTHTLGAMSNRKKHFTLHAPLRVLVSSDLAPQTEILTSIENSFFLSFLIPQFIVRSLPSAAVALTVHFLFTHTISLSSVEIVIFFSRHRDKNRSNIL